MAELGFTVIKTKSEDWWHRKDGAYGSIPVSVDDEDDEDDEKPIAEKTEYPSFYIDNCPKEIYDLSEDGTATVTFRVTSRTQNEDSDGKVRYSVSIDIKSFDEKKEEPKRRGSGPLSKTAERMDKHFGR
jgi:hypothetical protein